MNEEYLEHFSSEITEDIETFAIETAFLDSRYIFTTRNEGVETGYCTHCKTEFKTDKLKHNSKHKCPNCGSKCTVKQAWRGHKYLRDEVCFTFYEKSLKDPNVLVAKGYSAYRDYGRNYRNVYNSYFLEAIYIFDICNHKARMFKREYWSGNFRETKSIYSFNINSMSRLPFYCSTESIKEAIKKTNFKYCPYKKYLECNMLNFFELYTKYPIIEQLTKVGFDYLIKSKLIGCSTYNAINWKGKDIFKMLRINRKDLRDIREAKIQVTPLFLKLYQISKKDKSNLSASEVKEVEWVVGYNLSYFNEILQYTSTKKTYKYIRKQMEIKREGVYFDLFSTWRDYISDCIKLNMDLKSENVLFPKDVHAAHQNTIKQVKIKADKQLNIAIGKRLKALDKYTFEKDGLIIRPAHDSIELLNEGKALCHCVGGYAERYSKGTTNIFFIRKVNEIDKPFYTLEFRDNAIIQVRGKNNCSPTKEVQEFVDAFKTEKLSKKKVKVRIPA